MQFPQENIFEKRIADLDIRVNPAQPNNFIMDFSSLVQIPTEDLVRDLDRFGRLFLVGPSGCGKTRKLTTLLSKQFGIYLSFRHQEDEKAPSTRKFGSRCLTHLVEPDILMRRFKDMDFETPHSALNVQPSPAKQAIMFDRRECIHLAVYSCLSAYGLIFEELTKLNEKITPEEWLFVQLFPLHFFNGIDLFETLAERIFTECSDLSVYKYVAFKLNFYCVVIDEAQEFSKMMEHMFISVSSIIDRTQVITRSLLSALQTACIHTRLKLIVAGTGKSLANIVLDSRSNQLNLPNADELNVYTNFPVLKPDEVERLLLIFFPSNLGYPQASNMEKIKQWLWGRPRIIVRFLEEMIHTNCSNVSELLDRFILKMTDPSSDEDCAPIGVFKRYWSRFDIFRKCFWKSCSYDVSYDSENLDFVELGISFPRKLNNATIRFEVSPEPLYLEAARRAMNSYKKDEFLLNYLREVQDSVSALDTRFECICTLKLIPFLGSNLNDPNSVLAELIQTSKLPDILKGEWEFVESTYGKLAHRSDQAQDFYSWATIALKIETWNAEVRPLFNGEPVLGVFYPDQRLGPDIVAVGMIRDERTKKVKNLVAIFIQAKLVIDLDANNCTEALLTVDPNLFHHSNRDITKESGKAQNNVTTEFDKFKKEVLKDVAVIRVLVSGVSVIPSSIKLKQRKYPASSGFEDDLVIVLSPRELKLIFGEDFLNALLRLKKTDPKIIESKLNSYKAYRDDE